MTEKNKKTGGSSQRQDRGHEKSEKGAQKPFKKKEDAPDPDEEPVREADFGPNDPNDPNSPEKRIQIDDDPDETKRKIPHMNN